MRNRKLRVRIIKPTKITRNEPIPMLPPIEEYHIPIIELVYNQRIKQSIPTMKVRKSGYAVDEAIELAWQAISSNPLEVTQTTINRSYEEEKDTLQIPASLWDYIKDKWLYPLLGIRLGGMFLPSYREITITNYVRETKHIHNNIYRICPHLDTTEEGKHVVYVMEGITNDKKRLERD